MLLEIILGFKQVICNQNKVIGRGGKRNEKSSSIEGSKGVKDGRRQKRGKGCKRVKEGRGWVRAKEGQRKKEDITSFGRYTL